MMTMMMQCKTAPLKFGNMPYQVASQLDSGPWGATLRIADTRPGGEHYLLKVIEPKVPNDPELAVARAALRAARRLQHPAILKCLDLRLQRHWTRIQRAELLLEDVEGASLDQVEESRLEHLLAIFRETASALVHMHSRTIIHGDLRPRNILLTKSGQIKVAGYGLTLIRAQTLTQCRIPASRRYIAPERLKNGTINAQTDIYSLGGTMFRALMGRSAEAFGSSVWGIDRRKPGGNGNTNPTTNRSGSGANSIADCLNASFPERLNALVVSCLQVRPEHRPTRMIDVLRELEAITLECKESLDPIDRISSKIAQS